jgi:heptosyltransferase I
VRILIVRLSAMGDIIHAMPAIAGVRRQFPEARVDWAIEERWLPLLTARNAGAISHQASLSPEQPLVDFIHPVHMRRWRQSPFSVTTQQEIRALRSRLHEMNYDHAIDLQGAIRSAMLAKSSGAKVRAGALHPREFPARWWYNVRVHTPARHVIGQAAEIVSAALGRHIGPEAPAFPQFADAESWVDQVLHKIPAPFAIINPGAGWGAKRWPVERYAALGHNLGTHGISSLVNAGPGEKELAYAACHGNEKYARVIECTLQQLIALTRRAALFVGGDTGPLHLASALEIPVVAIFGPTDPARNGPYGGQFAVLRSPESKRDHSRHHEPEAGLLNITVEQVTTAALTLLQVPA